MGDEARICCLCGHDIEGIAFAQGVCLRDDDGVTQSMLFDYEAHVPCLLATMSEPRALDPEVQGFVDAAEGHLLLKGSPSAPVFTLLKGGRD